MGSGASAGVSSGLASCTDTDLKAMCDSMPQAEREKLMRALGDVGGAASGGSGGRKYCLGANWKCNPTSLAEAKKLCVEFKKAKLDVSKTEVVIFAPAVQLMTVKEDLAGSGIEVGVQNISKTNLGAFTGEIPASVAADMGIPWALVGHSERRKLYGETIEDTVTKFKLAQDAGLKVMFACGEQLEEREAGKTDDVNKEQLGPVLGEVKDWDKFVIAYEPVWAIGTGKVATPEQAQETCKNIRSFVQEKCGADIAAKVRIQYGGSSSPDNIEGLACNPDIDGFLVGGASLKPTFNGMIEHLSK